MGLPTSMYQQCSMAACHGNSAVLYTYSAGRAAGLTEHFYYDNLHRLDYATFNGTQSLDLSYDALGNIAGKSGVGAYTYHPTKKHAVIATSAASRTFTYDNNGNQITRSGHSVSWYPSNLPKQINAAGNNTSAFHYDIHGRRYRQIAVHGGVTETTTYVGGLMEVVVRQGVTSYRHYIAGGTGTVAEHIRDTTGLNTTRYLTRDHLGSVDTITSATGSVLVRLSYDEHGERRNELGWSGAVPPADKASVTAHTRRGFTEHDMLDNLNLVHMNGRVYDPEIGRFISADPFIDGVGNTQGWNRYSYVANNPLSMVDPSGYAGDGMVHPIDPVAGWRDGAASARWRDGSPLGGAGLRSYDFSAAFSAEGREGVRGVDRPDIRDLATNAQLREENYRNLQNAQAAAEAYRSALLDRSGFMEQLGREYGYDTGAREHLDLPSTVNSTVGGSLAISGQQGRALQALSELHSVMLTRIEQDPAGAIPMSSQELGVLFEGTYFQTLGNLVMPISPANGTNPPSWDSSQGPIRSFTLRNSPLGRSMSMDNSSGEVTSTTSRSACLLHTTVRTCISPSQL